MSADIIAGLIGATVGAAVYGISMIFANKSGILGAVILVAVAVAIMIAVGLPFSSMIGFMLGVLGMSLLCDH